MKASHLARYLLIALEGFRSKAYKCSANTWTVGFGTTRGVRPNTVITFKKALEEMEEDIQRIEGELKHSLLIPISQNQYDALVSFIYNIGIGAWRKSTLLKLINEAKLKEAANEFDRWSFVRKIMNKGLLERRRIEKEVFLSI